LDCAAAARALRSARREGRTLDVLLSADPGLSLADAYRIQDQMTALRLADGERPAGWKLGYTSAVMRAQMGIEAPNFGPLTDVMLLGSPAVLPPGALQPRIEPEIGLRLGRRLVGPCSVSEVLGACDAALACLEVVDSVWSGYRFTLADNTADGSSAAWVVVGPVLSAADLAALPVALSVDGEVVERGTGAAASGHPAAGVAWLAERLAARGLALEPGDLVITGGLTSAHPLEPGHRISASFGDGRWQVEVRRPRLPVPRSRAQGGNPAAGAAALAFTGILVFTLFVTGYQVRESRHSSHRARPLPPGTAS
jgi:2-keto-4-pentenoate hydratase